MTNAADNPGGPPEPASATAGQPWAAMGGSLIPVVVLVVLALLLYGFVFREGPAASIAGLFGSDGSGYATGFVEIDTPEVYTRERLVNDRFVEDTWLKDLLSSSATKRSLPSLSIADSNRRGAEVRTAVASAAGDGQSPGPKPEGPAPDANGDQPPSVAAPDTSAAVLDNILAFKADQLYRQTIRQAIIENQLDDTHDLRGNSLYLFKFDASVLPTETNRRQLRIDMELSNRTSIHAPFTMSDFIQRNSPNAAISDAEGIYELWLQGVNAKLERLRAELRQAFNRATVGDDFSNDVKTEFRQRFGFPLAGDASNPDALLAALKGEGDRIMRKLKPRQGAAGATPEVERARGFAEAFAKRTTDDCSFLDKISSEESEGAAQGGDVLATAEQLGAEAAQQNPTSEADLEAMLSDVRRCLTDFVITNWAMRLNFGTNGSSTGGTRSVWDYVRPVYRPGGAVDFQRRIDFYLVSFPSLMGECFKQEECMQTLGGYQFVGSYDLDDSQRETLRTAIAATAQRPECGDFKLADTPTSVIIYGLPGQKSGAVATPLPLDALSEILRKGSYSCSFKDDPLTGFHVNFERGLFNFIESVRERSRGYSYSVMPREDLQIVAREFDSGQSFKAGGGGVGVSGDLSEERKRAARAVEGEATIVGFGSTRSVGMPAASGADGDGALEFGWIIWPGLRFDASGAPVYQQVPMQKSLSALVSIPAWWERVHICGRYEWLDTKREASNREQRFEDLRDLCRHSKASASAQGHGTCSRGSGRDGREQRQHRRQFFRIRCFPAVRDRQS